MGMSFQEAIELYRGIYHRFEKVEGKPWGVNGAMIELSKQVGDLSKCIMLKEEYYAYKGERPVGLEKNIGFEVTGRVILCHIFFPIGFSIGRTEKTEWKKQ